MSTLSVRFSLLLCLGFACGGDAFGDKADINGKVSFAHPEILAVGHLDGSSADTGCTAVAIGERSFISAAHCFSQWPDSLKPIEGGSGSIILARDANTLESFEIEQLFFPTAPEILAGSEHASDIVYGRVTKNFGLTKYAKIATNAEAIPTAMRSYGWGVKGDGGDDYPSFTDYASRELTTTETTESTTTTGSFIRSFTSDRKGGLCPGDSGGFMGTVDASNRLTMFGLNVGGNANKDCSSNSTEDTRSLSIDIRPRAAELERWLQLPHQTLEQLEVDALAQVQLNGEPQLYGVVRFLRGWALRKFARPDYEHIVGAPRSHSYYVGGVFFDEISVLGASDHSSQHIFAPVPGGIDSLHATCDAMMAQTNTEIRVWRAHDAAMQENYPANLNVDDGRAFIDHDGVVWKIACDSLNSTCSTKRVSGQVETVEQPDLHDIVAVQALSNGVDYLGVTTQSIWRIGGWFESGSAELQDHTGLRLAGEQTRFLTIDLGPASCTQ